MAKFCSNCGNEMNDNQDVCLKCGKEVNRVNQNYNGVVSQKSKVAAGLLAIFLGTFGVHNFYLGYTGKAVTQLLLTILSCGLLSIISAIWSLIEGILILTGSIKTDGNGNPLSE